METSPAQILEQTGPHEADVQPWLLQFGQYLRDLLGSKWTYILLNICYEYLKMSLEKRTEYFEYIRLGINAGQASEYFEFSALVFVKEEKRFKEDMARLRHDTIERIGPPCRFCRSENTQAFEHQTRGGDEGITITVICQNCGRLDKIAG